MYAAKNLTDDPTGRSLRPGLLLAIATGAALGGLAREHLSLLWNAPGMAAFPWGTLAVNLAGALLLGLFATYLDRLIRHALFRPFWELGFCRSFTTLSALSLAGVRMLEAGAWPTFLAYFAISSLGGLGAVFAGEQLGALFSRRAGHSVDPVRRERVERDL